MEIKKTAVAGTLESSDIQIMITQAASGITIELESDVAKQFGAQIKHVIQATLEQLGINAAHVKAVDKGALDCVIKARTIAAAQRAAQTSDTPAWEVL